MMKSWKLASASLAVLAVVACESGEDKAVKFADNAQHYFEEGELNRARIQFQNALKNDPDNPDALRGAAKVAEREERLGDELRYLQRLSNIEPSDMEVLAKTARLNLLAGRPERAQRRARRVLDNQPENIEALTVLGAVQVLENDLEGASETLELALEQDPENAEVRNLLAARYVRDEDFAQASTIIEDGLKTDPNNEALLVVRLLLNQRRQDADGMDQTLARLIEVSPSNGFYRERYAQFLLAARGDVDGARAQLTEALPLVDDRTEIVGRLVGIIRSQDGNEAGEAALMKIIADYSDDEKLAFALPSYLCETGQEERCVEEFKRLANSDVPDIRHQAKVRLGERSFADNDLEGAMVLAEEVLADDDSEPNALTLKGKLQLAQGETQPAIETLRTALGSEPDKESAQILLGLAYEADGRASFGEAQLAQAIDRNGLSPTLFQAYRDMLTRNGKTDDAADLTLQFAQTADATPQIQRESAAVLLSQNRADEAELVTRALIRADGGDHVARRLLATAQLQKSQPAEAIATIEAMSNDQQNTLQSVQIKAQALTAMQRIDDLRAYLTETATTSDLPQAYVLLTQFELGQDNLDAAERAARDGLEAYPDSQPLYLALYNTQIRRGNLDAGAATLRTGIDQASETATLRILLSNEHLQNNQREDAKRVLLSLKEDNQLSDLAANNLAALMLDLGDDAAEALELAQRFEDTEQPFFADTLAWAHYRNGNVQQAKRYSDVASRATNPNAEILYHRGVIAAAAGDVDAAREALSQALEAPGKNDIVNEALIQEALDAL